MKVKSRRPDRAIAYIRVSSDNQEKSGVGLEGQLAAIRSYASGAPYTIIEIYSDTQTARGADSIADRPGLQAAIDFARTSKVPILVAGFDRLSRHSASVEEAIRKNALTIISTEDGAITNPLILASRAARAEVEGDLISLRTKEALQRKKEQGVRLGNPTNLGVAQMRGAASNKERGDRVARTIAEILDEADQDLKAPEVVELLNQKGIKTSRGITWTISAVRRPLQAARKLLEERSREAMASKPNFGRF
jgi:DNA invertase Pin-like site-specific DNA recombinase